MKKIKRQKKENKKNTLRSVAGGDTVMCLNTHLHK